MPKKYITITLGESSVSDVETKTPLSIFFESICTTTVNGVVFKLPSRDADAIVQLFEEDLLLKVNANKSDRIQIRTRWVPVNVMPFSKKLLFEGEVQESPIPKLLRQLHNDGIDLRILDPLLANFYLSMAHHVDFGMQISVLRGIPVVSTKWSTFLAEHPDNIEKWLFHVPSELMLPDTKNDYVFPNVSRPQLLAGASVIICHEGSVLKQANRLYSWVSCLGCTSVSFVCLDGPFSVDSIKDLEDLYVIACSNAEDKAKSVFTELQLNTSQILWEAVVDVNRGLLHQFNRKSPRIDSLQEPDSLRLTQRRKRRKVERVSDTDFFLFSQVSSSNQVADSIRAIEEVETPVPLTEPQTPVEVETADVQTVDVQTVDVQTEDVQTAEVNADAEARRESIDQDTKAEEPKTKKMKVNLKPSNWIVPQVSLADAIRSTKQQATESVKQELGTGPEDFGDKFDKLVIVEEVDLTRKNRIQVPTDNTYRGRKNFKAFRKNGPVTLNVTRTFIELQDDTSNSEILFDDSQTMPAPLMDFENEMDSVKGYQPQASQLLFVGEDSDAENGDFSFLTNPSKQIADSDDENDFAFTFSRR